jgi:hypothetical protein
MCGAAPPRTSRLGRRGAGRLSGAGLRPAHVAGGAAGVRPRRLKERYGPTRFGQSRLLARRLVENGVPFVQVNWSDHVEAEKDAGDGGWDHHYRNFQFHRSKNYGHHDRKRVS